MKYLITGSSSGIGFGLAKFYLEENHEVVGCSRRTPEELNKNKNYTHYNIDLQDFSATKKVFNELFNKHHDFDKIILNAGILGNIKDFSELSIEEIQNVMEINVYSNKVIMDTFISTKANANQIIGISSGSARIASRGWGPYSISKAALNILIKAYAFELPNIHFCALAPGLVDTEIQEHIYSMNDDGKFPAIGRLQSARYTDAMPDNIKAAELLHNAFNDSKNYESGSFLDVREM